MKFVRRSGQVQSFFRQPSPSGGDAVRKPPNPLASKDLGRLRPRRAAVRRACARRKNAAIRRRNPPDRERRCGRKCRMTANDPAWPARQKMQKSGPENRVRTDRTAIYRGFAGRTKFKNVGRRALRAWILCSSSGWTCALRCPAEIEASCLRTKCGWNRPA